MSKYISENERYKIETMLKDGIKPKEIASRVGKHFTTIYREIKRGTIMLRDGRTYNNYPVYCADVSQRKQEESGHNKGRDLKIGQDIAMANYIEDRIINDRYSPEAVIFDIDKSGLFNTRICVTTLYSYIDKGIFFRLSNDHLQYKKEVIKGPHKARRPSLRMLGAKTIEDRPKAVYGRESYGHWEMDTVVSGKRPDGKIKSRECVLSMIERQSREVIVRKISDRCKETVVREIGLIEQEYGTELFREKFKSITVDNGVEFSDYHNIEISPGTRNQRTELYFCHPFCSCERGSNENVNRLIRRWMPKGCSMSDYDNSYIKFVQDWINNYPRRMFGGLSSKEYKALYCIT